jgi:hypothetical protein
MAAEWILQTYAYDPKQLRAYVGNGNVARARAIAKAARELVADERIVDLDITLADAVTEIATRKMKRQHAIAYRIALEAIMNALGKRVRPRLTTYALKPDVGRVLVRLGQRTLGRAWNKPALSFPTPALARECDWPMATTLDARAVAKAKTEALELPKSRADLDAKVTALMPKDPTFATDVADAIVHLGRVVTSAARTKASLMLLVDGEQ